MSDGGLAAFFAKKAAKKKKGAINLQEIGEQLERRAQEQIDEVEDEENKTTEEAIAKNRLNNDNEDSEWLDYDDKPNIPIVIKEMPDVDIELANEEKRTSAEPVRTWNLNTGNEPDVDEPVIKKETEKTYVPKAMRTQQLDLSSEEMFPTIEKAPEVEQKLKAIDEENRRMELEKRRLQEEEKAKKEKELYKPRRGDGESPRKEPTPRRTDREPAEPSESETANDWRSMQKMPKPTIDEKPTRFIKPQDRTEYSSAVDNKPSEEKNWRDAKPKAAEEDRQPMRVFGSDRPEKGPKPVDEGGSWRRAQASPTPAVEEPVKPIVKDDKPQMTEAGGLKKYIPPSLRRQQQ